MILPLYYADTSVVGGRFDREFCEGSTLFWDQAREGRFRVLISPLVREEIFGAPDRVKTFFEREVTELAELVEITEEIEDLADAYLRADVLGERYWDDALHVAAATVARARALVSWNFQHLVNIRREDAFNSVNMLNGYATLRIVSPLEVIEYAK